MLLKKALSSRIGIFVQLAIAIALVLAANLLDIIPMSETPYLLVLAILSMKLQKQDWSQLGLNLPANWGKTILIALVVAIAVQGIGIFFLDDLIANLVGSEADLSSFEEIKGNTELLLLYLALIWTLAAFGEEISYRGFVMTKMAELIGPSKISWVIAIIACSALFGIGHYYKGPAGMMDSAMSGLVYGLMYVLSKRNLWLSILTHGFIDTLGVFYFYFGLYL